MRPYLYIFLGLYVLLLLIGVGAYLSGEHGDLVIWLNQRHTPFLDIFFKYGTYLGDGVFLAAAALILIIVKRRHGLILGLLGLVQAIVSALLKRVVFGKIPRPKKYFQDFDQFQLVEGVDLNGWYSFPSGHTMTAFSIATFLMLTYKNMKVSLLCLMLAVVAGISRVYLLQHFLIDILVGSFIGVLLAFMIKKFFQQYLAPELE